MPLEVKNVSHSYGDHKVLNDVNLKVGRGQFVAVVGPSGCGKSTLLRAILGTHLPTEGKIYLDDDEITRPTQDIGIVYQHYSLYDFLTARKNVAFGPKLAQTTLVYRIFCFWKWLPEYEQMLAEAEDLLIEFGLKDAITKHPSDLSGGMRQRVAIAQAVIMHPKVLLLDEPFGALDEVTRHDLQLMLLHLYQANTKAIEKGNKSPYTVMFVTHELNEAFYVADRVIGLSQYHGHDVSGAKVIYDQPAPVYTPNCPRDFTVFREQKEQLKKIVFNENQEPLDDQYIHNWEFAE